MTRLVPALRTFDNPDKFASYARRTVRNHCVDLLRRRVERDARVALRDTARATASWAEPGAFVEQLAATERGPEQELLRAEQLRLVRGAVDELGEPGRTIIGLIYGDGLTYLEVAERLGLSSSKVKRTLGVTRGLLAVRLREGGSDDAS
jgi:RNA polymerase sigma factor (sigma-70 family)